MGLDIAIDELYATGWSSLDPSGCVSHTDGRSFPTTERIMQEFAAAGFTLTVKHEPRYACYRASWRSAGQSEDAGAVVGRTEAEAAVYALVHLRRRLVAAAV